MRRTTLPIRLQHILDITSYVTIATTCLDGKPWNTPVVGCFDDHLNLYWASWTKNRHSHNILVQPIIFAVVFDSHAPDGEGLGLYLQMKAHLIDEPQQVTKAREIYTSKFGEDLSHDPFLGECPRRLYQATPLKIWCNTDSYIEGNFVDTRVAL